MGKINLSIDDELEKKFRLAVAKKEGMKKGNLGKAVEQAMRLYMRK